MPAIAGVMTIKMKKMTAMEYTPFVIPVLAEKRSSRSRNRAEILVELAASGLVPCTVHSTQQTRRQTIYEHDALDLKLKLETCAVEMDSGISLVARAGRASMIAIGGLGMTILIPPQRK